MATPWEQIVLVEDDDLTVYESRMPEIAKVPLEGSTVAPFTNKRQLAKDTLYRELSRRDIDMNKLVDPMVLKTAAVFMELHLIFNDIGTRIEWAPAKTAYYGQQFDYEMKDVVILEEEDGEVQDKVTRATIIRRA